MTITRRGLHDEISRLDKEIETLQNDKRGLYEAYRAQLTEAGQTKAAIKLEIEAFKKAERKLRALTKDADAELERDGLVDEIVAELQKPVGTPVATRTRASRADDEIEGRSAVTPGQATHCAPATAESGTVGVPAATSELIPEFMRRDPDDPVWRQ